MFAQDFEKDLDAIRLTGEPYCLSRFADGELAFLRGHRVLGIDGWTYDGSDTRLAKSLREAIRYSSPGYCVGVSCPCCDMDAHIYYTQTVMVPPERLTYSNLFANGNHDRWLDTVKRLNLLERCELIACTGGTINVPANALDLDAWDVDAVLGAMYLAETPILVAAGPVSCHLIYEYWKNCGKQLVLDVGSSLDVLLKRRRTRSYHRPEAANRKKVCHWSRRP